MKIPKGVLWSCQIVAAMIIGFAAVTKFVGTDGSVFIFSALGMEPFGRYLIGAIELTAASMLLTSGFAAIGALFAIGTMLGATIAHLSYLGLDVDGDAGARVMMLSVVLTTAVPVLIARRQNLPLIGSTL